LGSTAGFQRHRVHAPVRAATASDLPLVEDGLHDQYFTTRLITEALCEPLDPEDMVVQSMPDCSPAKWHLAHTAWFFEQMVLASVPGYRVRNGLHARLFNSYYQLDEPAHPRAARGQLSRPRVAEVIAYRRHVDTAVLELIRSGGLTPPLAEKVVIGLHHEQQHQELLLTDILHLFSGNPVEPVYRSLPVPSPSLSASPPLEFHPFDGGILQMGAAGPGFSFDNERPAHRRLVAPFSLASRLTTNGEYLDFIRDGGYRRRELWLAAGWDALQQSGERRPIYWSEGLDEQFTLGGQRPLDAREPVSHVSYFEADAFARWANARLPREEEWELAAQGRPVAGNFLEQGGLTPQPAAGGVTGLQQMYGDVWEWTQSAYGPYPGFTPHPPPLDQYNGQFMVGQMVLRGGSCLSPAAHIRPTYRNFLPPGARWQVSGIRLARDP